MKNVTPLGHQDTSLPLLRRTQDLVSSAARKESPQAHAHPIGAGEPQRALFTVTRTRNVAVAEDNSRVLSGRKGVTSRKAGKIGKGQEPSRPFSVPAPFAWPVVPTS